MIIPKIPGGYMDGPPESCPKAVNYCPNPVKYEILRLVEYIRCEKCSSQCSQKHEMDVGRRRRISLQRNGE